MAVVATLLTIVLSVILTFPITVPVDPKRLPYGIGALEPPPENPANPSSPSKIELGHRLFFDPLLSSDGTVSCATCHLPEKGFADGERTSMGIDGYPLARHTPTVVNAVDNSVQNWDGKFTNLADHAVGAMTNPRVMNLEDEAALAARLEAVPSYDAAFREVFGDRPTKRRVAEALEVYVRTLVTTNSRFDQWARGDKRALSESEKRGLALFIGKASCAECHRGPNFTDNDFHALGVTDDDPGRFKVTKVEADRGAFKTPALRNVATTAPYMHDGSLDTLRDVVDFYNDGGGDHEPRSRRMRKLGLTEQESQDLVAFMVALTGPVGSTGK